MPPVPQDKFGLVGATLDRKFRIERIVTEGGFGILYYGTHLMLDRPIALKVLKIPSDFSESGRATFIDGFAREAKTIVRISHQNIVAVLDFGVSPMPNGEMAPWMALEWLNGPTLREVLVARRGHRGQGPQEVLAVLRPVLEALAYAHEEGIAHRDIKPANMMLVPTKRGNVLKLLDFGIAKAMEHGEEAGTGLTQTSSSLNAFSLAYAAPEQIGGSRTGPWTDVHAMALIITEMLTDMAPYDGKERTEICVDALSARRPTPGKRNVDAGPWEHILAQALSLRPAERFATAGELLQALEATLAEATAHTRGAYGTGPNNITAGQTTRAAQPGTPPYAPQMPVPYASDAAQNPTTLRGMTTGAQPSVPQAKGGSGRAVAIGALVVIGTIAGGAAIGLTLRARGTAPASAAASVNAPPIVVPVQSTPVVGAPVVAPVAPPVANPVVAAPAAPAPPVVAAPSAPVSPVAPAIAPVAPRPAEANPHGAHESSSHHTHANPTASGSTHPSSGHAAHGSATPSGNQSLDVD